MKSLLHICTIFHGWFYHKSETVEVKKSEGANSNGKSFDETGSASKSGNTWERKFPPDPRVSTGPEHTVHKFRSKDSGQK